MSANTKQNKAVWIIVALMAALVLAAPRVVEMLTGQYQNSSLQPDVNSCTRGMLGEVEPREVKNICTHDIVVGLCLSDEINPMPCRQSFIIKLNETATFETNGQKLSSLPSNPNGLTVVACRVGYRPSRTLRVGGKGHRGVCLPPK